MSRFQTDATTAEMTGSTHTDAPEDTDASDDATPTGSCDPARNGDPEWATDPGILRDREGVDYAGRTYEHEDADHCEADAVGRVVVGVSDPAGRYLLQVSDADEVALLPNATVDDGDSFLAAARRAVADLAGVTPTVEGPERARRVEHVTGDGSLHNATHHVTVRASVDREAPAASTGNEGWTAGWYDEVPVKVEGKSGDALDDVLHFLG